MKRVGRRPFAIVVVALVSARNRISEAGMKRERERKEKSGGGFTTTTTTTGSYQGMGNRITGRKRVRGASPESCSHFLSLDGAGEKSRTSGIRSEKGRRRLPIQGVGWEAILA